jgi:hypothetical protein
MSEAVTQQEPKDISEHSMKLAFAVGGRTDVALTVKDYTFQQLAARLRSPRQGAKDGSYYIRGGDLVAPKRADENLRSAELLILDGDSRIDPETGEILSGAPPMPEVCQALRDMGIAYIAHTSHSYRPVNGGGQPHWKYRVVIPALMRSQQELQACVQWILAQLHSRGVWLADVTENSKWSQPWYLPRVEQPDAFLADVYEEGKTFPVDDAIAWAKERAKREQVEQKLSTSNISLETSGDIDAFNKAHGAEWVRSKLESQGYKFVYKDGEKLRFIRPGSESGTPGVVVFRGARGDWCVYSHHGAADPLSNKVSDPFDLVAIFDHNGDRKAAARSVLPKQQNVIEQLGILSGQRLLDPSVYAPQQAPQPLQVEQPKRRIDLVPWHDLQDVKVKWLVKDMLPARSFSAIYGKSGAGKSFFAMYLAAMIAAGREAFGCDVEQGDVVYLALEGGAGLRRRRDALMQRYDLPDNLPVHFVKAQMNLRSSLDDLQALIAVISERGIKPAVVFVDTLARAYAGGEENSSAEMMQFVSVMAALQDALDCTVCVVHHTGKDESRGMRGSSALLAAVDAELELTRISDDEATEPVCTVKSTKQKDGMDGLSWSFRLDLMHVSQLDPDATSLVVHPLNEAHEPKKRKRASGNQKVLLEALQMAISEQGKVVGLDQIPAGQKVVHVDVWRTYFDTMTHLQGDSARRTFEREVPKLGQAGHISMWAKWCWITEA